MRKFILTILLSTFPLVCFAQNAITQTSPSYPLQLTIKSNKSLYIIGDEVAIKCKVKNISKKVVSFYSAYLPEINFQVICENEKICPTADAPQTTDSISLIVLNPKEALEYSITGKIIEGKGNLFITGTSKADSEYTQVGGIFLEVHGKGKVYLKGGFAKYVIKAYYKDGSSWAMPPASDYLIENKVIYPPEVLEKFKDKWQGRLTSNTIQIEVVRKKELTKEEAVDTAKRAIRNRVHYLEDYYLVSVEER